MFRVPPWAECPVSRTSGAPWTGETSPEADAEEGRASEPVVWVAATTVASFVAEFMMMVPGRYDGAPEVELYQDE